MSRLLDEFNVKRNQINFSDDYNSFKDKNLLDEFRVKILEDLSDKGFVNQVITKELINSEIDDVTYGYDLTFEERSYLFNLIDGEVNGFGPISCLFKDDNITEIMVNSPSEIYIEVDGVLKRDDSVSFINEEHIIRTIERMLGTSGKNIDINNPIVDAMLEDGSRINAIIPPLVKSPIITIRKFRKNIVDIDDLIGNGSLTLFMARFLEAAVKARLNIIVSGGVSGGKTTLLNILSNFIPNGERIITIEDVRELRLLQEHVVSLETRNSNNSLVTVRDLVRNSLRMRPDRVIIGEVRGAEAFDLLQAMNTGFEGALTSLHANSAKDALGKLETMILMNHGMEISTNAIREYINDAVDLVVHISRMKDGKRKIVDISEVVGVKNNELVLKNIFKFKNDGVSSNGTVQGEYQLQEYVPVVLEKIKDAGVDSVNDMFVFKKKKSK